MFLILDTETNGLPNTSGLPFGSFPSYKELDKYDTCKLLQLSYIICDKELTLVKEYDTIISNDCKIENSYIHELTEEICKKKGIDINLAFDTLIVDLQSIDTIIGHNIFFDINVLKSEAYRHNNLKLIELLERKKLICTMRSTINFVGIINEYGPKFPRLGELYYKVFNKPIENAHNSKYDVLNLYNVLKELNKHNVLKLTRI